MFQNGLVSMEVRLNTVSPKTVHIAFIVSCLEKRRMMDMMHFVEMVGMELFS